MRDVLKIEKFQSRFTSEQVEVVRFTGEAEQTIDILNWVVDNDGRAQGEPRQDGHLDLKVHERGVGLVLVKPGEYVMKTNSGFEVHPVLALTSAYQKVAPVTKVIKKPVVYEAMQFTGGIENESELEEWLKAAGYHGTFRHAIPGTTITYYRIETPSGSRDVPLNSWIVKSEYDFNNYTDAEFAAVYDIFMEVK